MLIRHKHICSSIGLLVVMIFLPACKDDKVDKVSGVDIVSLPAEKTINIRMLYTENGEIKNELKAQEILHFKTGDSSYYRFPQGIYASSYEDSVLSTVIMSKKAIYRQSPEFFEATDTVEVKNYIRHQSLFTDTLYWDAVGKRIYNYSPTIIMRPPDTIPATAGFEADQEFRNYTLRRPRQGTVFFEMNEDSVQNTGSADSMALNPVR